MKIFVLWVFISALKNSQNCIIIYYLDFKILLITDTLAVTISKLQPNFSKPQILIPNREADNV